MRLNSLRSASCALAVVAVTASMGTVATGQGAPPTVAVVTSAAFPVAVAATGIKPVVAMRVGPAAIGWGTNPQAR